MNMVEKQEKIMKSTLMSVIRYVDTLNDPLVLEYWNEFRNYLIQYRDFYKTGKY